MIFIPGKTQTKIDVEQIERWYQNVPEEIRIAAYPEFVLNLFKDTRYSSGKLLKQSTRPFFMSHFAVTLANTVNFVLQKRNQGNPLTILECGSGLGHSALWWAVMGHTVYAVDLRSDACDGLRQRKAFYETVLKKRLKLEIINQNLFDINFKKLPDFDLIDFQFSFNFIRDAYRLIPVLSPKLKRNGIWAMHEGNNSSLYNRLFRKNRNAMTPFEIRERLHAEEIHVEYLKGCNIFPPVVHRLAPKRIVRQAENSMCHLMFLCNSYQLIARK
jgi:hypothetical protein